jgi:hypothetical protein
MGRTDIREDAMDMGDIIAEVLESIGRGRMFDDNYVIDRLFRLYPDELVKFVGGYADMTNPSQRVSAAISNEIGKFEGTLVEKQEAKSVSANIQGLTNECTLWKRI